MKIHSILLAVLFALTISVSALGQSTISIGTSHTLFSQILNEERTYWIYEPEGYSPEDSKSYPVLYLLDGDSFFHSVVGFTRFFASSRISNLPPCIVVAVLNTDRTRDFTPTSSAARRDGTLSVKDQPQGGGAEQFYRFITEELRLEVEKKTSSNRPHFFSRTFLCRPVYSAYLAQSSRVIRCLYSYRSKFVVGSRRYFKRSTAKGI